MQKGCLSLRCVDSIPKAVDFTLEKDTAHLSRFVLKWKVKEDTKYRLLLDSMAFTSVYGVWNDSSRLEFRTQRSDFYSTIKIALSNVRNQVIVQALDEKGEKVLKEVIAQRSGVVNPQFPSSFNVQAQNHSGYEQEWPVGYRALS